MNEKIKEGFEITLDRYPSIDPKKICSVEPIKCNHPGCHAHVSHPCEKCGRINEQFIHDNWIHTKLNESTAIAKDHAASPLH